MITIQQHETYDSGTNALRQGKLAIVHQDNLINVPTVIYKNFDIQQVELFSGSIAEVIRDKIHPNAPKWDTYGIPRSTPHFNTLPNSTILVFVAGEWEEYPVPLLHSELFQFKCRIAIELNTQPDVFAAMFRQEIQLPRDEAHARSMMDQMLDTEREKMKQSSDATLFRFREAYYNILFSIVPTNTATEDFELKKNVELQLAFLKEGLSGYTGHFMFPTPTFFRYRLFIDEVTLSQAAEARIKRIKDEALQVRGKARAEQTDITDTMLTLRKKAIDMNANALNELNKLNKQALETLYTLIESEFDTKQYQFMVDVLDKQYATLREFAFPTV